MRPPFDRITFDPQIMGGQGCVRGMRISASLVLNLLAHRMGVEDMIQDDPDLESEDILACLGYGWPGSASSSTSARGAEYRHRFAPSVGKFSRTGYWEIVAKGAQNQMRLVVRVK
ncbi:DUF433 domain-containing protein [bacterium]|nr:DUF433 domain-containing protein [bacterium]